MVPKGRIVAESAILPLAYRYHIIVGEWVSVAQSFHRLRDASRIVKHAKRIHQGIKSQAMANAAHLIGEAGTEEEQTVAVMDGLI